jgi:hypothetical protein
MCGHLSQQTENSPSGMMKILYKTLHAGLLSPANQTMTHPYLHFISHTCKLTGNPVNF